MSQTLTLELSDPVFAAIRQQAETMGIPPERLAAELLEQKLFQAVELLIGEAEKKVARSFVYADRNQAIFRGTMERVSIPSWFDVAHYPSVLKSGKRICYDAVHPSCPRRSKSPHPRLH